MSALHTEHAEQEEVLPVMSHEEDIAHAKEHAWQNFLCFIGFGCMMVCTVLYYEYFGVKNMWVIFAFAAIRSLCISAFLFWLMGTFSLVLRTIVFTVFFFGGMVFLSIYDSDLPTVLANPITHSKITDK